MSVKKQLPNDIPYVEVTKQYKIVDRLTVGQMIAKLTLSGGNLHCMPGLSYSDGNNVIPISSSWDYLQTLNKNKKFYILEYSDTSVQFVK